MTIPYTHERYLLKRDQTLSRQRSKYHADPFVKERKREYDRKRRAKLKDQFGLSFTPVQRDRHYKQRYGISLTTYEEMYQRQNGCCAICYCFKDRLFVDHSHTSLKVRGLLCRNCNHGLGNFRDNPELLETAVQYLEKGGFCHNV